MENYTYVYTGSDTAYFPPCLVIGSPAPVISHSRPTVSCVVYRSLACAMSFAFFNRLLRLPASVRPIAGLPRVSRVAPSSLAQQHRALSSTPARNATFNQVMRGCRQGQKARRARSPAIVGRPEMKGVCVRVGITKPKKPNSGERKVARVRLSSGTVITAYIPGEGRF